MEKSGVRGASNIKVQIISGETTTTRVVASLATANHAHARGQGITSVSIISDIEIYYFPDTENQL